MGDQAGVLATPVAAVITCHNYGRFLAQCLDSLLAQTRPFAEVVVVDDASDDDTAAVCARYPAVRYLRVEHRCVCRARDAGEQVTKSPLLCFVDADNWLDPEFVERLLPALGDPDVAVSYARPRVVDDQGRPMGASYGVHTVDTDDLSRMNCIDTCCLLRRQALHTAGGWSAQGNHGRYGDWHLWLRIADRGWKFAFREGECWTYRLHDGAMSRRTPEQDIVDRRQVLTNVAHLCVVTPFCGRDWCLDQLIAGYRRIDWDPERLHLVAIDNSCSAEFGRLLRDKLHAGVGHWAGLTLLRDGQQVLGSATNEEYAASAALRLKHLGGGQLAHLYAYLAAGHLPRIARLVLTVEDDIEIITDKPIEHLLGAMTDRTMAVGGVVVSRFDKRSEQPMMIAYDVEREDPYQHHLLPFEPTRTDVHALGGQGMGLVLWRGEVWRKHMAPRATVTTDPERWVWHDCAIYANLRRAGFEIRLHRGVRTRHHQRDGSWV